MKQNDLRETATRKVILRILHAAPLPLSPPDIVKRCHLAGRRVNKTTIYRDLVHLESAGIVHRVIVSDRKQYFELTERDHHHHFVCLKCHNVEDVLLDEADLSKQEARLARKNGFSVLRHSLEFFGRCKLCM